MIKFRKEKEERKEGRKKGRKEGEERDIVIQEKLRR